MENAKTVSLVWVHGSWLGTRVADSAAKNQGIFAVGREVAQGDLQAINSVVTNQPAQNLIDGYVGTRGVVSPGEAKQELINFGNFLRATDPAAFQKYKDLLADEVNQLMAKHPGMDRSSAVGIALVTAPYADPKHPTASEHMRTSIGLDIRVAAILYAKTLASIQIYLERGFTYQDGFCPVCVSKSLLKQTNLENQIIFFRETRGKRQGWINAFLN